jgi:putative transposase
MRQCGVAKQSTIKSPKLVKSLVSKQASSENGIKMDLSKPSELQVECDSSTSLVSVRPLLPKHKRKKPPSQSSIQECHHRSKEKTSKDNKTSSRQIFLTNVPDPQLTKCQTLDQVLTLKEPDCYRFWDESRKDEYQRLSWLRETDLPDLVMNSSNGCAPNLELKSWFSTLKTQPQNPNSEKTSWQSSKFIAVDGMAVDDTRTKIKARKLKLRPTKDQKQMLNQWAGCVRFLYNKTIAMLTNPKNKTIRGKFRLRDRFATIKSRKSKTKNSFYKNKPWLEKCPNSVRQGAIYDANSNLQSCFTNKANGNIDSFKSPYRTKKKEQLRGWSFSIEKQNIQRVNDCLQIFPTMLGDMRYYGTKQLRKLISFRQPEMDCKIQKNAFGEYFLIVPYLCVQKKVVNTQSINPVAVDPGVRKFLTTYAPNAKESYMLGNRWSTSLMTNLLHLDSLYSNVSNARGGCKRRLNNDIKRARKRIFNLKAEMRFKCANFLASQYDLVMMPKLESGKLSIKANRRLTTKTTRCLLNACHAMFFDTLKDKCWEHGTKLLHVREEYTSQTCPQCGCLNKCDEVYKCKECSFIHDRDIVGAFNILLKGVRLDNPGV